MFLQPIYTINHLDFLRTIVKNYIDKKIDVCELNCKECFLNCKNVIGITDQELYSLALNGLSRAGKLERE